MKFKRSMLCDTDRIMEILTDGRKALALQGVEQWQGLYPDRTIIESDIASQESYVVENDQGDLIATTVVGLRGEKDYSYIEGGTWLTQGSDSDVPYAVIHRMAVDSSSRGSGAADLMLAEAESLAALRGKMSVRVDTHPNNIPMTRLLEKNGYTRCGIIYIAHAEEFDPSRIAFEKLIADNPQISDRVADIACA